MISVNQTTTSNQKSSSIQFSTSEAHPVKTITARKITTNLFGPISTLSQGTLNPPKPTTSPTVLPNTMKSILAIGLPIGVISAILLTVNLYCQIIKLDDIIETETNNDTVV